MKYKFVIMNDEAEIIKLYTNMADIREIRFCFELSHKEVKKIKKVLMEIYEELTIEDAPE